MPNIRINALPTTASASSSDDYIALDGTTNGTRKLNAYSPTFGGNLTVSGTGNSSIAGNLLFPVNKYVYFDGSGAAQTATIGVPTGTNDLNIGNNNALLVLERVSGESYFKVGGTEKLRVGASATTLAGNLTVSGTGTSSFAGTVNSNVSLRCTATNSNLSLYKDGTPSKAARVILNGSVADGLSLGLYNGTSWTDTLHISTNNNVLIGTTTDGGQKLQVNGTAYVSGATTIDGQFKSNSTQEAQFGGAIRIKNAIVADAASAGFLDFVSGATRVVSYGADNSTAGTFSLVLRSANSSVSSTALSFDTSSNATFAGNVTLSKSASGAEGPLIFIANSAAAAIQNRSSLRFGTSSSFNTSTSAAKITCEMTNASNQASSLYFDTYNGANVLTALTLDSSQNFKLTPAVASSITTTQSAPQIRMGSRASGRSNVVLDSTAGRVWSLENTGTSLTIGYSGLDAITIAETTGDATFAGSIRQNQANNISLTSGVATTIFSLGTSAGVYIVTATLDVNAVAGYAIVGKGATGSWQVLANSGTQMSFSMSTNDLQITQSSGSTSTTNTFNLLRLR